MAGSAKRSNTGVVLLEEISPCLPLRPTQRGFGMILHFPTPGG